MEFAAADVAAPPPKGNRGPAFSIRFTTDDTRPTPCCARSRQLKPLLINRPKSCRSAPKSAPSGKSREKNSGPRHGNDHVSHPLLPGARQGDQAGCSGIKAFWRAVLRPGIRPLPAGTALHARTRAGLPCQAAGAFAGSPVMIGRIPGRQGSSTALNRPHRASSRRFSSADALAPRALRATMVAPTAPSCRRSRHGWTSRCRGCAVQFSTTT